MATRHRRLSAGRAGRLGRGSIRSRFAASHMLDPGSPCALCGRFSRPGKGSRQARHLPTTFPGRLERRTAPWKEIRDPAQRIGREAAHDAGRLRRARPHEPAEPFHPRRIEQARWMTEVLSSFAAEPRRACPRLDRGTPNVGVPRRGSGALGACFEAQHEDVGEGSNGLLEIRQLQVPTRPIPSRFREAPNGTRTRPPDRFGSAAGSDERQEHGWTRRNSARRCCSGWSRG
jgi:hypothetical protein